jgi:ribose/xylose/arabinose/galactoside ABC-type transport system permease subunit
VAGTLIINYGWNTWLAIVAALLVSMVVGVVNGFMVEKMRINPVIVTLGTLIAVRGAGQAILWINNSWIEVKDPVFDYVAAQRWWFLPVSAAIMLALFIVAAVLLKGTVFGRQIYAIGGNERAAALCGLPVTRVKWLVYVLCSLFAGIAGLLTAARTGVVGPTVGLGYEFDAVTAVVLGGASLSGGVGRVEKTLLGALMLVMVLNYMTIRGIQDIWQTAVTGLLILAAVTLDRLVRGRRTG